MPVKNSYPINQTYGKANVVLLEEVFLDSKKQRKGKFRCDCGNEFIARISEIIKGVTIGCGCRRKNHQLTHGLRYHELYNTYSLVHARCYCKTNKLYSYYGGRGIIMSDEFKDSPEAFINYLISLPNYELREEQGLSLDRINNDDIYRRDNLRWATKSEQMLNRRQYVRKKSRIEIDLID